MINATNMNTTPGTQPQPTPVAAQMPQTPSPVSGGAFKPVGPKKIFGMDMRTIGTVVGLTGFFLVAMLGVTAALQQYFNRESVAPTAPSSRPAAFVETPASCTIRFSAIGPTATPSPSPSPTPPGQTPTPSPSPTPPGQTPSPSPTPSTYVCGGPCTTDAQCQTVNSNYVCANEYGNTCRLDSNRGSSSCQPPAGQYACNSECTTDAQCQTVNSAYMCSGNRCRLNSNPSAANCQPTVIVTPVPVVGCNQPCSTNADCSNSAHICYTTADGSNRCRLDNYPNSDTCTTPNTIYTPVAQQPQLPEELPKTGPKEWSMWLGAGLATLGIGALLLLLI